jgi:hypothetical protein
MAGRERDRVGIKSNAHILRGGEHVRIALGHARVELREQFQIAVDHGKQLKAERERLWRLMQRAKRACRTGGRAGPGLELIRRHGDRIDMGGDQQSL